MLEKLVTEQSHAASRSIDELPTAEILNIMNAADAEVPAAVAREIPRIARAVDTIALSLEQGGHLVYIGAGTSGRLGVLDASECPPTFNVAQERGDAGGGGAAFPRRPRRFPGRKPRGSPDRDIHALRRRGQAS